MSPLQYDTGAISSTAADWANNLASQGCALIHGDHDNLGQNLFMEAGSGQIVVGMQDMFDAWSSEDISDAAAVTPTGPANVCMLTYTNPVQKALDLCSSLEAVFGLASADFGSLNPTIACATGISSTQTVCLEGIISGNQLGGQKPAPVNSTLSPTHPIDGCLRNATVSATDTCITLATQNVVTISELAAWNYNLDCWNLPTNASICVNSTVITSLSIPVLAVQNILGSNNQAAFSKNATSTVIPTASIQVPTSSAPAPSSTAPAEQTAAVAPPVQNLAVQAPDAQPQPAVDAPAPAPASVSSGNSGNLSPTDQANMLAAHNNYRAQYGMPPLQYDPGAITSTAADWAANLAAQGCALIHGEHDNLGQNLFMEAGSGQIAVGMQDMFDAWSSEDISDGVYNHATQALWYNTQYVGCAIQWGNGGACEVLVCDYYPAGNVIGYQFNGSPS
ncbi:hypothetical protein HDU98_009417 [Podochytrium sp. JEL0797]|nr:hypothetical protein HDU98_009417 [Podochytrium sp. JEL0797]